MKSIIGCITVLLLYIVLFWVAPLTAEEKRTDGLKASLALHIIVSGCIAVACFISWCFS